MVGKLLRYDMKALFRTLLPLQVVVGVMGVVACLCAAVSYFIPASLVRTSPFGNLVFTVLDMGTALGALMLFLAPVAVFVAVVRRFYMNLFTDEGYLTLTLPASASAQVLSKLLSGLVWVFTSFLISFALFMVLSWASYGFDSPGGVYDTLPLYLLGIDVDASSDMLGVVWVRELLGAALDAAVVLLVTYAAFSLGAAWAARHKVATALGLLVIVSWVVPFLYTMVVFGTVQMAQGATTYEVYLLVSDVALFAGSLCTAGAAYAICVYVLNRKVNLA